MGLIALAIILPASAAGPGGNGKMLQNATCSGLNNGNCTNPNCQQIGFLNNQTPSMDGTGMQYGKLGSGRANGGQSGQCDQGCGNSYGINSR